MAVAPLPPVSSRPAPAPAPMSEGARLVNVFIAPARTFSDLRRTARWWAPWLAISIFSLIFIYAIDKQVGFEQVSKNQIAHSARADQFDKLPPDQQAKQLQVSSKIISIFAYGSPAFILFYVLVETLALWVTFKFAAGGETTFGQAYAISMYAGMVGIVGAVLGTISLFAGVNPEGFDINNPVGTNLAYYLDPETTGKFVRAMASSLDVMNVWTIVLIGIGFACTSKVKRSTAIGIVAGWYLFFKLATSAIASFS
ncbi:MAG TPA: YIP1 family protein [Candidatus Sulfotelmatobacter sp.]|nr:YIP1 family protein [Candidatus Sulfotelmatobacter sp.]